MSNIINYGHLKDIVNYNRENGKHEENYIVLSEMLKNIKTTIDMFGTEEVAHEMYKRFLEVIRYNGMNFHAPKATYELLARANDRLDYNLLVKFLDVMKNQKPCQCGCCK